MGEITSTSYTCTDIWYTNNNRSIVPCTLTSGTVYQAGDLLGQVTSTGLYVVHNAAAVDGSEVGVGILTTNADASAAGQNRNVPASMAIRGEFNNAVINRAAGATAKFIADVKGRVLAPQNALVF